MPDLEKVVDILNSKIVGCEAKLLKADVGDSPILVKDEKLKDVCLVLRDDPELDFNVLHVISGVDFLKTEASDEGPAQEERIEVNYMLTSFSKGIDFILKVKLDRSNPRVESVVDVWASANFQERECFDMLGVEFIGHPDLRRVLCPEDWEGFPLRKDYVVQKEWHGMEVNPEIKMNLPEREFEKRMKEMNKNH